jgi:DNA-binding GntR family transcriptional regulator
MHDPFTVSDKAPDKTSLAQRVYDQLKAEIMTNRLAPGEVLQEEGLAQRLGASRTPIRDALRMLQNDGLVAITHNRGSVITEISIEHVLDAYEIRELLEPHAALVGAARTDPGEIDRVESMLRRLTLIPEGIDEVLAHDSADETLHDFIARASGNALLRQMVRKARLVTRRLVLVVSPDRSRKAMVEHLAILAACRKRDGVQAGHLLKEHIHNAKSRLLDRDPRVGGRLRMLAGREQG